jgi:hypothetical protein
MLTRVTVIVVKADVFSSGADAMNLEGVCAEPPMITFVTGLFHLREDRSRDRSAETRIALFRTLESSGIKLHLFTSPEYADLGGEVLTLEELEAFRTAPPGLPAHRTDFHDTRNFLAFINAKIELVTRAMATGTSTHYAWIDFSICHVFRDLDTTLAYLSMLGQSRLRDRCLLVPGCWGPGTFIDRVNWRFCGGFFVGDRQSILEFHAAHQAAYRALPHLTWEVNTWARAEFPGLTWYAADHDDSIVRIPPEFFYTVASLTTIPPRMDTDCRLAVESLRPQVDAIYLTIPDAYDRFPSRDLPEWMSSVHVCRGEDKGPASKYLGALADIPRGAWVFVCDDDQEYHPTLLARMKQSLTSLTVYQNHFFSIEQKTSGGLIHGYVGLLLHESLLRALPEFPLPEAARFVDDQWMSAYCATHGIPIAPTSAESYPEIFKVLENGHEKLGRDSLSGLQIRDQRVKELEAALGVVFTGPTVSTTASSVA